jgi:hypothetical protein
MPRSQSNPIQSNPIKSDATLRAENHQRMREMEIGAAILGNFSTKELRGECWTIFSLLKPSLSEPVIAILKRMMIRGRASGTPQKWIIPFIYIYIFI